MKNIQKDDTSIGIKIIDFTIVLVMLVFVSLIAFILLPTDFNNSKTIRQILDIVVIIGLLFSIVLILKPYANGKK